MKLLVLLCGEDDDTLQVAAAGALAMLTAAQKKLCTKLTLVVCTTEFSNVFTVEYYSVTSEPDLKGCGPTLKNASKSPH